MAPEDKMLARFATEKQRKLRGADLFNLEDEEELTHFGQSLGGLDDFQEEDLMMGSDTEGATNKRKLGDDDEAEGEGEDGGPARKKTKAEVMKEVIAKSKLHKYERQKAKEADQDVREELDAQLKDLWPLLQGNNANINSDRLARMTGEDTRKFEKNYDEAVKELVFDKRAAPADKTKTEEEKAAEEAERLKRLEEARIKRMNGEIDSDDEMLDEKEKEREQGRVEEDDEEEVGEAEHFGFGKRTFEKPAYTNPDEIVEDDFLSEDLNMAEDEIDDLLDQAELDQSDDYDSEVSDVEDEDDLDAEFLADVMPSKDKKDEKATDKTVEKSESTAVAFTYPCPASHAEFLKIIKDVPTEEIPTVVRRIRVLHHARLQEGNKEKLEQFALIIFEHILHMADTISPIPSATIDTLIRHLHAMSKVYNVAITTKFRESVRDLSRTQKQELKVSDLVLFNMIGIMFSTSDNYHPIVTPTQLCLGRFLDQTIPNTLVKLSQCAYICMVLSQYQRLSKRFVPEALNYIYQGLTLLAPVALEKDIGSYPVRLNTRSLAINKRKEEWRVRQMNYTDLNNRSSKNTDASDLQRALLLFFASTLEFFAELYVGKAAFYETFKPGHTLLKHILQKDSRKILNSPSLITELTRIQKTLTDALARATLIRRPLELHHHRPLPIPSNIPKFIENYNLDKKSYDPNEERVEMAKLKAEHKKERKGALRELRKDSRFIAREKIKEERVASKEYHAKMKRLTAMIQTEEGTAANEYERERARRKKK